MVMTSALGRGSLKKSPDARTITIKVKRSRGRVEILRFNSITLALEEFHRDECIEEVGDAARMKTKLFAQFRAGEAAIAQRGEEAKGDSREQNFGISGPKAVCRIGSGAGGDVVMIFDFALKRKFATCLRSGF